MKWVLISLGLLATSCVVRVAPAPPPPPMVGPACAGAVWVPGHYDALGRLVRPHWRCPSGRIVVAF